MARLPRYFVQDVPLHIILRGNNRAPIFGNDEDCRFFKASLLDAAGRHSLAIHAYVFMTNHIHLLASPGTAESVPKTMQSVGRRYVQYFNFHYKRTGTLWEGRYRATVVDG
jgi:putative transposase